MFFFKKDKYFIKKGTHTIHPIPPCHICNAKCCRYFALEIDRPKTIEDFENLRWYLLHEKTFIFVDCKKWYLQINNPCQYIQKNHQCGIYKKRPQICRDYGLNEKNKVHCDKITEGGAHDLEFSNVQSLERYIKKRFPRSKIKR